MSILHLTGCNFDYGLCSNWSQNYYDDFSWTNQYGSTPSFQTGPSSDHSGYGKLLILPRSLSSLVEKETVSSIQLHYNFKVIP